MQLFPYTRKRVDSHFSVNVSNHFFYSDFGVRSDSEFRQYGRRYICSSTPGTGFIEHESESQSYHDFVRSHLAAQSPSYLNLLLGREPNYERELSRANEAFHAESDPRKREILECYANALNVGKGVEYMQRVIRAIKNKMGHHQNKYYVSIISRYKRRISQLEKDMEGVEYHLEEHYSAPVMEAYRQMTEAFSAVVQRCRRIWHHNDSRSDSFVQVFFDLGIFDFIRCDTFIPLMRDSEGRTFYLLPDAVIVARTSLDFDIVPLKSLTFVVQEMAIEEPTELLSKHLVDAACMIQMPALGAAFYFNHYRVVIDFMNTFDHLKSLL